MAIPANLDAFLPREAFSSDGEAPKINEFSEMGLTELREQWSHLLRKPDFQRTTDDWDAGHISDFIKSFVEGDVIPGVIFWASPTTGNILVVDGAHRISAMLAWMADDYGDGKKSKEFLGFEQNSDQDAAAVSTRELVKAKVAPFKEISSASSNPSASSKYKTWASSMTAMRFKIQWLRADAKKAEDSFYRINLRSVALNKTEIKLIRDRDKPPAIATRAIIQNAMGHKFWESFPATHQKDIERLAKCIHALLFSPPLANAIKSAHLPIAGKSYSGTAMEIALDIIECAYKHPPRGKSIAQRTVFALECVEKVLSQIGGSYPNSLGLHPAVYFYSHATGKHQPAALMAVIKWLDKRTKDEILQFASVRSYFEDFVIQNAQAIGKTISVRGSKGRSVPTLVNYLDLIFRELVFGKSAKQILDEIRKDPKRFPFGERLPETIEYGATFSSETKAGVFLTDALAGAPKCRICGARYQPDSVNADHITSKSEGGNGHPKNLGPSHYYCNSSKQVLAPMVEKAHRKLIESPI